MPTRRLTLPAVATLAVASIALGTVAALADGDSGGAPKRAAAVPAAATGVAAAPTRARARARARYLRETMAFSRVLAVPAGRPSFVRGACVSEKPPAVEPVPQSILDAFGVLRRERTPDDALPASALRALRARGLEPFDPAAARLLRRADGGGKAWVVPVRDVPQAVGFGLPCVLRAERLQRVRPGTRVAPPAVAPKAAVPARPRTATAPRPAPAPAPSSPPVAVAPLPAPAPGDTKPHPGLAVVAVDGAPAGAGGRLEDLVRGRENVAVDPCGGPNRDMLSVSGIVPDGVPAAFLTSSDGTAVRADVKDNAYNFVVPRAKRPEQRYVVWTGGDGTPHVQPLAAPAFIGRVRCPPKTVTDRLGPVVSPDGSGPCGGYIGMPAPLPASPKSRPRPLLLDLAPCMITAPLPAPATPKARRAPKRHK